MKLLFITTGYFPVPATKGGAVNTLLDYYLELTEKKDIVVYSINGDKYKDYVDGSIEYRYINKTLLLKIKTIIIGILNLIPFINLRREYISLVLKDVEKRKENDLYDFVILENTPKSIPFLRKQFGDKVILHLHNDYLNVKTKYKKKIVDDCLAIFCVSNYIKDRVREIKANNKNIFTVYNGIDIKRFKNNFKKNDLRKKYNIDLNKKVIIYVGRLLEKKGIFELIYSFQNVKNDDSLLLVVGDGTDKIKKKLKKITEKNDNIKFINYVDNKKIHELYALSDIGVVPSKCNEAFGLTALEGLTSNLKMIVSNDGALPEVVFGQKAVIIDKNNLEQELSRELNKLLNDDYNFEGNNIDYLEKKFDISNYVTRFDELLDDLRK